MVLVEKAKIGLHGLSAALDVTEDLAVHSTLAHGLELACKAARLVGQSAESLVREQTALLIASRRTSPRCRCGVPLLCYRQVLAIQSLQQVARAAELAHKGAGLRAVSEEAAAACASKRAIQQRVQLARADEQRMFQLVAMHKGLCDGDSIGLAITPPDAHEFIKLLRDGDAQLLALAYEDCILVVLVSFWAWCYGAVGRVQLEQNVECDGCLPSARAADQQTGATIPVGKG